jgi:hypothetical protein
MLLLQRNVLVLLGLVARCVPKAFITFRALLTLTAFVVHQQRYQDLMCIRIGR